LNKTEEQAAYIKANIYNEEQREFSKSEAEKIRETI
jgi:hypothetical protein